MAGPSPRLPPTSTEVGWVGVGGREGEWLESREGMTGGGPGYGWRLRLSTPFALCCTQSAAQAMHCGAGLGYGVAMPAPCRSVHTQRLCSPALLQAMASRGAALATEWPPCGSTAATRSRCTMQQRRRDASRWSSRHAGGSAGGGLVLLSRRSTLPHAACARACLPLLLQSVGCPADPTASLLGAAGAGASGGDELPQRPPLNI